MFFKVTITLLFCAIVHHSIGAENIYEGFKIYEINAKNNFEKDFLLQLSTNNAAYDFLALPKMMGKAARVLIAPQLQSEFEENLQKNGLHYTLIDENLGRTLALDEKQQLNARSLSSSGLDGVSFDQFHRYSEILSYLDELAKKYPYRVSVKTIGKSYENRFIKTITISNGDGRANKKVILMDAGIHAREWIAHAAALYVINQLVENFSENSHLLRDYDWVIIPVVNPDGYEYTHAKNRMWRKTRKPSGRLCVGTDGNRNFDFHWGETGASSNSCDEDYMGQKPFSEQETRIVRDVMIQLSGRAKMYLTLHSFGNYILYPWGFTSDLPSNVNDLDEVAQAGAAAIRKATRVQYTVGSSTNVLYAAAGGSDDYALEKAKIPISITMELQGGGSTGFNPSISQIEPYASEAWIGIKAMAEKVIQKY